MELQHPVRTTEVTDFVDPLYPDAVWKVTKKCKVDGTYIGKNSAHAHDEPTSSAYGLICIHPTLADDPASRAHEYAHLLNANRDAHGKHWRKVITDLGYPTEAKRYENRRRTTCTVVMTDGRRLQYLIPLQRYDVTVASNNVISGPGYAEMVASIDADGEVGMVLKGKHARPTVKVRVTQTITKTAVIEVPEAEYQDGDLVGTAWDSATDALVYAIGEYGDIEVEKV